MKKRLLWGRRYFVLKADGAVEYYKSDTAFEQGAAAIGVVSVFGGVTLMAGHSKVGARRASMGCLEINTPAKTLFVQSDTVKETVEWRAAIDRVLRVLTQKRMMEIDHKRKARIEQSDSSTAAPAAAPAAPAPGQPQHTRAQSEDVDAKHRQGPVPHSILPVLEEDEDEIDPFAEDDPVDKATQARMFLQRMNSVSNIDKRTEAQSVVRQMSGLQ
jgi:hypothetical protein